MQRFKKKATDKTTPSCILPPWSCRNNCNSNSHDQCHCYGKKNHFESPYKVLDLPQPTADPLLGSFHFPVHISTNTSAITIPSKHNRAGFLFTSLPLQRHASRFCRYFASSEEQGEENGFCPGRLLVGNWGT